MKIIQANKKIFLFCFSLFFLLCVWAFSAIKYKESILVMVPSAIVKEVSLFQSSPLSKRFFIVVDAPAAQMDEALRAVTGAVAEIPQIKPAYVPGADFILSYYYNSPKIWNKQFEKEIMPLLTPGYIEEKMQENIQRLMGPEGMFFKDFIVADPLGLLEVFSRELKSLNITGQDLNFSNGALLSADGTKALLMYDTNADSYDRAQSAALIKSVEDINKVLPPLTRVFTMGAARYTQENNDIIKTDVRNILILSIVLMFIVFLFFFRDKRALFIYIVPVLVLIPAAVFTFFIFGEISGITIGFGSVLMGLAVDYSVYMFFALKAAPKAQNKNQIIKAMFKPVVLSAATSIISFAVLFFCTIDLFKQIAVFAAGGLLYALFLAFVVSPLMFKTYAQPEKDFKFTNRTKPLVSVIMVSVIIICGMLSLGFLRFDTSLDSLNTVSLQFEKDRDVFDALTGHVSQSGSLLFVFGDDKESALQASEKLAEELSLDFPAAKLFPSIKSAQKNTAAWHDFWTESKIKNIKKTISSAAREYGLDPAAFEGFYKFLSSARAPAGMADFDMSLVYSPFAVIDGKFAVTHIVGAAQNTANINLPANAVLVSQDLIQRGLFYNVIKILVIIMAVVVLADFALLLITLKDAKIAIIAFIPLLCGISMIFIFSALFKIKINLFSLFSIPLIIGLGVDYAIFVIHQCLSSKELHPSRAVASAALLTLAGFGALIIAKHKVLFAIGLTVTIGIAAAVAVSIFLLPAMIKHSKKTMSLLLIIFLFACAGHNQVKFNMPVYARSLQEEPLQYRGELNAQMPFNAAAVKNEDGSYRVIILNDFGIKFADFTVAENDAQIHSYQFIPKRAASALALFFKDFYFAPASLVCENNSYKGAGGRIILWVENE